LAARIKPVLKNGGYTDIKESQILVNVDTGQTPLYTYHPEY